MLKFGRPRLLVGQVESMRHGIPEFRKRARKPEAKGIERLALVEIPYGWDEGMTQLAGNRWGGKEDMNRGESALTIGARNL